MSRQVAIAFLTFAIEEDEWSILNAVWGALPEIHLQVRMSTSFSRIYGPIIEKARLAFH